MTVLRFHQRTLVVADDGMKRTLELAGRAANSNASVLISGESGTGKELIARFIHEKSRRCANTFVSINCAAIPEGLMEAELFGYEKGAFTGAIQLRVGKFERANGGTLLLDEISEMSIGLQAKLLRVLQEGEIDRLGSRDPIQINSRVIATTNRDPRALMEEGLFREDLFYRLNVIRIECLPLRGRPGAIRNLAQEFVRQSCLNQDRAELSLASASEEKLMAHEWPGNIRELQNAVERAVLLCDGRKILPDHLELGARSLPRGGPGDSLASVEQAHIERVLNQTAGNRTEAARMLGISVRTLRNKLNEYGG